MSEVAVLIPSTDSFSDVWPATVACFEKFWPDCPWPVVCMSNETPWPFPHGSMKFRINVMMPDSGWCANLRESLDRIGAEFVLMLLEDMLIDKPVDTAACIQAQQIIACQPRIGAIRLGRGPEKTDWDSMKELTGMSCPIPFARILHDSAYRISTSPTLWRVSYLRKILDNCGATAWEFETRGTEQSRMMPEEIWVQSCTEGQRAIQTYYTAITRGKWDRNAVEWLKREVGVEVNVDRGFMA